MDEKIIRTQQPLNIERLTKSVNDTSKGDLDDFIFSEEPQKQCSEK